MRSIEANVPNPSAKEVATLRAMLALRGLCATETPHPNGGEAYLVFNHLGVRFCPDVATLRAVANAADPQLMPKLAEE